MKNGMVGIGGERNLLANIPRTKKGAFNILLRVERHLLPDEKTGKINVVVHDPSGAHAVIQKAITAVARKWVRPRATCSKDLQRFHHLKKHIRRVQYQNQVQVFAKPTVSALRSSLPKIHGQGALRKPVAVYPYRPMDTFLGGHRVNVYRSGSRFDVIDALCNIPILAGLTRRGLKKIVQW